MSERSTNPSQEGTDCIMKENVKARVSLLIHGGKGSVAAAYTKA